MQGFDAASRGGIPGAEVADVEDAFDLHKGRRGERRLGELGVHRRERDEVRRRRGHGESGHELAGSVRFTT